LAFAYEKQEDRDRGRGGEAGAEGFEHRCRRGGRRNRLEEGASEIDRERESLRVVCIDCVCMWVMERAGERTHEVIKV
jgi:hypothetical protein